MPAHATELSCGPRFEDRAKPSASLALSTSRPLQRHVAAPKPPRTPLQIRPSNPFSKVGPITAFAPSFRARMCGGLRAIRQRMPSVFRKRIFERASRLTKQGSDETQEPTHSWQARNSNGRRGLHKAPYRPSGGEGRACGSNALSGSKTNRDRPTPRPGRQLGRLSPTCHVRNPSSEEATRQKVVDRHEAHDRRPAVAQPGGNHRAAQADNEGVDPNDRRQRRHHQ